MIGNCVNSINDYFYSYYLYPVQKFPDVKNDGDGYYRKLGNAHILFMFNQTCQKC